MISRAISVLPVVGMSTTAFPWLRRLGSAGAATLIFCCYTTTLSAQGAGGTSSGPVVPANIQEMKPRHPLGLDPFAAGPTLQAHRIPEADLASLIREGWEEGDIAFEALAVPLRDEQGQSIVAVFVEIDGPSFLRSNPDGGASADGAQAELYVYTSGSGQEFTTHIAEAFAFEGQETADVVWQGGLKYYSRLSLPPGHHDLHFLLRSPQSTSAAVRTQRLSVPDTHEIRRPRILPVVPPPPGRDGWLSVRGTQLGSDYPFMVTGRAISPMVRPVLVAGRRMRCHLFAHGLSNGGSGRVELLQGSTVVASAALALADRRPDPVGDGESLDVGFESPRVSPGAYDLRVTFEGGVKSVAIPVLVLHQNTRERSLVWADLRGHLPDASSVAATDLDASTAAPDQLSAEDLQVDGLRAAYRDALALWGQGRRSAARSAVLDLESSVLTGGALEALQAAQLQVAEQLASVDIESLLPVLILHDELYVTYRQRKLFSLGFNARAMIEMLADLYAKRGGTEGSRVVAARALASLAGRQQEANLPSNSRRLYRRALEYEPTNRTALLGLAISHERYGEFSQAIPYLESLVQAHPRFGEGLLRLAINLNRLGVRQRSQQLLDQVVGSEAPIWVRSLATQESARLLIEAEQLDQAAELLEKSLEEVSRLDGSVYLLTHIYDRRREAFKALELIKSLPSDASAQLSPRKTYDGWPESSLSEVRSELTEAAAVRAVLVTRALASPQPVAQQ